MQVHISLSLPFYVTEPALSNKCMYVRMYVCIARHAKDFTWNRGFSSNSPPLKHGDQIPHPLEDSDNQIPSSPGRQRCRMPGVCPGGACWSFDLTDTLLSIRKVHWLYRKKFINRVQVTSHCLFGSFEVRWSWASSQEFLRDLEMHF